MSDSILTNLRARFPDAINEREQARCGNWSRHGLGPCVCGDWRNHPGGQHPCPHPGCPESVSNDGVACPDHQEDES